MTEEYKQDWYQARAEIRVTDVAFDFKHWGFTIKGYIDLLGPDGSERITSKEFSHGYWIGCEDEEAKALLALLKKKCGDDLFGRDQRKAPK